MSSIFADAEDFGGVDSLKSHSEVEYSDVDWDDVKEFWDEVKVF